MFWMILLGYLAVAIFVAGPVLCNRFYADEYNQHYEDGKPNTVWGYGHGSKTGDLMTDDELQRYLWDWDRGIIPKALGGALIWPVTLYAVSLRYSATYRQVKEKQRKAEQKQQELDLERARDIIRTYRAEDHADYDKKLLGMDKTVGKLEKGKRR